MTTDCMEGEYALHIHIYIYININTNTKHVKLYESGIEHFSQETLTISTGAIPKVQVMGNTLHGHE